MVWGAIVAVCEGMYDYAKYTQEDSKALDEACAELFDESLSAPARNLPVVPSMWFYDDANDGWYYVTHSDITLWMIAKTYIHDMPQWLDILNTPRDDFSVSLATYLMWEAQPWQVRNILFASGWNDESRESVRIYTGPGSQKILEYPKDAVKDLPNGIPIKMPSSAVKWAITQGIIKQHTPRSGTAPDGPKQLQRKQWTQISTTKAIAGLTLATTGLGLAWFVMRP